MRDVFWLSLYPMSKQELASKGILPCAMEDTVKNVKDEWAMQIEALSEGSCLLRACCCAK